MKKHEEDEEAIKLELEEWSKKLRPYPSRKREDYDDEARRLEYEEMYEFKKKFGSYPYFIPGL